MNKAPTRGYVQFLSRATGLVGQMWGRQELPNHQSSPRRQSNARAAGVCEPSHGT